MTLEIVSHSLIDTFVSTVKRLLTQKVSIAQVCSTVIRALAIWLVLVFITPNHWLLIMLLLILVAFVCWVCHVLKRESRTIESDQANGLTSTTPLSSEKIKLIKEKVESKK